MPGKKGKTSQIPDDFGEISPKETATSGSTSGTATGVLLAMRTAAAAASAADAAKAKTLTEQEIKQRYDNSINAATPDLPGEYTGVTLENSSSTTDTEDILRGHLAKLKQADIRFFGCMEVPRGAPLDCNTHTHTHTCTYPYTLS